MTSELELALAVAESRLGHPFDALVQIEKLIVTAPQDTRFWNALAEQYEGMKETDAAAEVFQLALEETENFMFCWKLIRNRMNAGSKMEAMLLAEMAEEHWPERAAQIERVKTRIEQAA